MKFRPLIRGITTFIPGMEHFHTDRTGGTISARYCYSVWLRHLVMAKKSGLDPYPKTVAELGPGDSLGIGLAALISGTDKYFAFDVVEYANTMKNLEVFDELVSLFQNRENIPDDKEFPGVKPYLENYSFPGDIIDEERLNYAMQTSRLERIRNSINNLNGKESVIQYRVPWFDLNVIEEDSVDMIYSQAVLEHVDDLDNTYKAMWSWLKPAGYMSHQIDFKCHGLTDQWNGHRAYSNFMWKLIRGRRPYLLNREPHSTHIAFLKKEKFKIVCDDIIKSETGLKRNELAPKFRSISDEDLTISNSFIQALK